MSMVESMMEARLWRRLSFELVERVLSFLPVPDLCRFRTVCKRWDSLISTPEFGTLHLQISVRKDSGYIVARVVEEAQTRPKFNGWSILDVEAQRWYRIKHDHDHVPGKEDAFSVYGYVATNGGLVCEFVSWNYLEPVVISVYNPLVRRKIMRLPDTPTDLIDTTFGILNLVVDHIDNSFKVFFINQVFTDSDPGYSDEDLEEIDQCRAVMPIYESTTGQWRSSTNPPLQPQLGVGQACVSSVMFQGLLYILFNGPVDIHYCLYSYNIQEDVWEDTGVHIHDTVLINSVPQLIVSDHRLFITSWMEYVLDELQSDSFSPSFCVREILLADKALPVVFQMTSALVLLVFNIEETGEVTINACSWRPEIIHAFGFKKSLILMSRKTGITIVYNLVSRSWDRLPRNPMKPLPLGCELWYGQTMNLCLPSKSRN